MPKRLPCIRRHSGDRACAIDALAGEGLLYKIVAVGILLFGLLSLLEGYFRIVPDLDAGDLKPR